MSHMKFAQAYLIPHGSPLILVIALSAFVCCCNSMASNIDTKSLQLGGGNETDRPALFAIKAQMNQDPKQPVLSSWNESAHFCMWPGVTCSSRPFQRVIILDLTSLNLSGSISPHIGNLSFLEELWLYENRLTNNIPPEIGHLTRLQNLHLGNNSLSGPIPPTISNCFNLRFLYLYYNNLVGNIPPELGSLSKLESISIANNKLAGEMPSSLGNLSILASFDAGENNLVGSIPSSLGQLTKLSFFNVGFNRLSGTVPPSIYNLTSLLVFIITNNQIEGALTPSLFTTLPNLQFFSIALNQFIGSLPLSLSNATNLVTFQVDDNNLTEQVPNMQKLRNLRHFGGHGNFLGRGSDGDLSFLSTLINDTKLELLDISYNNFGGTLLASLCNISTLSHLRINDNRFNGSIPEGIGNLINMKVLALGGNMFGGSIPTNIGKLSGIEILDIVNTRLSGSLPSSLGNLTSLLELHLRGNRFNGTIPSSLGKCQSLLLLDLSGNNLSGHIPPQVIGIPSLSIFLDMSQNSLTGSLPSEIGKLENIGILALYNNMLSGEIPSSIGGCQSLEWLLLNKNFFEGVIPSTMASLTGLQGLNLLGNNLSGEIPEFLAELGGLKALDLAFNDFWGVVPVKGVFSNASINSVVGNTRLCGGISDLHLPKCKSTQPRRHSKKLTIALVSTFTVVAMAMLTFMFLCLLKKRSKETPSRTPGFSVLQVTYNALLKATDGFSASNLIGTGSFGSVYKGVLSENGGTQVVAVKVFNMLRRGASKSFVAECEALKNIRHRNLVPIITACSSVDTHGNDFKALVYKFMENGSLEEWLHQPNDPTTRNEDATRNLSLVQRLDIVVDVASAVDYLHNHCETPIVHCDLKPSNILLDRDLTAHIADFGLARFLSGLSNNISSNQSSSIGIRGTIGYAAPEYGMGSEVSKNGDVYSFGILLLEIFTGKRPTDHIFANGLNLHKCVEMGLGEQVSQIVDPSIVHVGTPSQNTEDAFEKHLNSILKIGVACSMDSPLERKTIHDVISQLKTIRATIFFFGTNNSSNH